MNKPHFLSYMGGEHTRKKETFFFQSEARKEFYRPINSHGTPNVILCNIRVYVYIHRAERRISECSWGIEMTSVSMSVGIG